MTRTASGAVREPRPNTTSAGAAIGTAAEVSIFWRRLPARISTFAPTPPLFDTRPTSCTANEWLRLPPSLTSRRSAGGRRHERVRVAVAVEVADGEGGRLESPLSGRGAVKAAALTSAQDVPRSRRSRGPFAVTTRRSRSPSLS